VYLDAYNNLELSSIPSDLDSATTYIVVRHPFWPESIVGPAVVNIEKAVRSNRYFARKLGWVSSREKVKQVLLRAHGWASIDSESTLAVGVANWQIRQRGLETDGIIGPDTWRLMRSKFCGGYESGEVRMSGTQEGHLTNDVSMHKIGLVVADFGVNSWKLKTSTRNEPLLRQWIEKLDSGEYQLLLIGFSDCVGAERDNLTLRERRALEVLKLLGEKARSKVLFAGAAKSSVYMPDTDNLAPQGRATNRSVLIQFRREFRFPGQKISADPASLKDLARRLERLVDRHRELRVNLSEQPLKRMRCFLKRLQDPDIDDRYVPYQKWESYGHYFTGKSLSPEFLAACFFLRLSDQIRWIATSSANEAAMVRLLEVIDHDIVQTIFRAKQMELPMGGGSSIPPVFQQLHYWISERLRDSRSIYHCYAL
jgi:hypothetical protein